MTLYPFSLKIGACQKAVCHGGYPTIILYGRNLRFDHKFVFRKDMFQNSISEIKSFKNSQIDFIFIP